MYHLKKLQSCNSLTDLSLLLGFKPPALSYILYIKPSHSKYTEFPVPKRNGGDRLILAPSQDLKLLQSRLSELLQDCIDELNKEKGIKRSIYHGFRRNQSIITNANNHKNKKHVFNIDIEDFFGQINFGRVRGFFIKNKNFSLTPKISTIIAQIACYNNKLPQGSPCSPVISNLIAHALDIKLAKLAQNCSATYSRYADDLTFSSNKADFPTEIAYNVKKNNHNWDIGKELRSIIQNSGFSINEKKTRMQYFKSRQDVTGLVTNKSINTKSEYWRTARAMVNQLVISGDYYIKSNYQDGSGKTYTRSIKGTKRKLNGILSHIDSIEKFKKQKKELNFRELNGKELTYQKFLYYNLFASNIKPIIICEGKTDSIYLKYAIRRIGSKFPKLGKTIKGKGTQPSINFLKYSKNTDRLLGLAGGTADLNTFISNYEKKTYGFTKQFCKQPVIILVDNDKGSNSTFSTVKKIGKYKTNVDGTDLFYHITENLYLVAIPRLKNSETDIEDFFDHKLLLTKIAGKSFNKSNKSTDSEYGKYIFAKKVVQPNWKNINFNNFDSILSRIEEAIRHYHLKS
ncbi:retron Ec67 family RNA-directed DNA polymerase/endonuclease [Marinobacter sp. NFXS9]|uniref:retron Ec67 family RNA-directed DNA polymerase/endonuclease n=1 Tax=Marinobacter sp. NFXS9 TaxID=2818433 RepID=UPI0032DEA20F